MKTPKMPKRLPWMNAEMEEGITRVIDGLIEEFDGFYDECVKRGMTQEEISQAWKTRPGASLEHLTSSSAFKPN